MKYIYCCLVFALISCTSANEKKKGSVDNNNGQVSDMGRDFSNPKSDASTKTDASPKNDVSQNDLSENDVRVSEDLPPDIEPRNQAPEIISAMISPASITEGESFTIRVQVSDPDGEADIVDARLKDRRQNTYGNFMNEGGGWYSKTVSWAEINAIRPITFSNPETLTFVAVFRDSAANSVKTNIAGILECSGASACEGRCAMDLCDGSCRNLEEDANHCGQCSKTCDEGCTNGICDIVSQSENYGARCNNNNDCTDGSCTTITSMFFNGDVCTKSCTSDAQCNGDSICADLSIIQLGQFCANRCSAQNPCLNGLTCQSGLNADDICIPF